MSYHRCQNRLNWDMVEKQVEGVQYAHQSPQQTLAVTLRQRTLSKLCGNSYVESRDTTVVR